MKMAVASKKEIDRAQVIAGILDDLDSGYFPRQPDGEFSEDDPDHFDENDSEHLRALYDRLMECGGLWRVTLGYATLTSPANKVIDPDLSYLELHPRLLEGREAADHPFRYWFRRLPLIVVSMVSINQIAFWTSACTLGVTIHLAANFMTKGHPLASLMELFLAIICAINCAVIARRFK